MKQLLLAVALFLAVFALNQTLLHIKKDKGPEPSHPPLKAGPLEKESPGGCRPEVPAT